MVGQVFDFIGVDDFLDTLGEFINSLEEKITDGIKEGVEQVAETVVGIVTKPVDAINSALDTVNAVLSGVSQTIIRNVNSGLTAVGSAINAMETSVKGTVLEALSLAQKVQDGMREEFFKNVDTAFDVVTGGVDFVARKLDDVLRESGLFVGDIVRGFADTFNEALIGAFQRIAQITAPIFSVLGEDISRLLDITSKQTKELTEATADAFGQVGEAISKQLTSYWGFSVVDDYENFKDKLDPILKILEDDPDLPPEIKHSLEPGFPLLGFLGTTLVGIMLGSTVGASLQMTFAGPLEKLRQSSMRKAIPSLLFPSEWDILANRMQEESPMMIDQLERQGYGQETLEMRRILRQTLLSVQDNLALWHREEIDSEELESRLAQLGYVGREIEGVKELAFPVPPVNDLIRFAVREVFTPEIAQEFGIFEDFPEDFSTQASKHGLSEFWQRAYWGSHWVLPSAQMGFEMLHRNVIDESQMDLLLRASDVMPFWRDKISAIAFRPFSRVDVRRMHRLGILDREGVKRAYLDLGYNDEKSEQLTDFTLALNDPTPDTEDEVKKLTRAQLQRFYAEKLLDREEALQSIIDIGYAADTAELFLTLEDLNEQGHLLDLGINTIKTKFRHGVIDFNDAVVAFDGMEIPPERRTLILAQIDLEREEDLKLPTRAELDRFLKADLVSEEVYIKRLMDLGYSSADANLFFALVSSGGDTET